MRKCLGIILLWLGTYVLDNKYLKNIDPIILENCKKKKEKENVLVTNVTTDVIIKESSCIINGILYKWKNTFNQNID